jgi:hypothetical protein
VPRNAEWISLAFFVSMTVIGLVRLSPSRAKGVAALGTLGVAVTLAGVYSEAFLSDRWSAALRDWLPVPLVVLGYRHAGLFFHGPNDRLQTRLQGIDDFFAGLVPRLGAVSRAPGVKRYLEVMYFAAYFLVPAGLAVLWLAAPGFEADAFWSVVLPATYFCYFMLPFAPTLPPRLTAAGVPDLSGAGEARPARRLNLWVLDRFGIGANTFPSGHVAATTTTALMVMEHHPWLGGIFLLMSLSIAVSVVVLRYHYLADAVLAAAVALLVWSVVLS